MEISLFSCILTKLLRSLMTVNGIYWFLNIDSVTFSEDRIIESARLEKTFKELVYSIIFSENKEWVGRDQD